MLQAYSEKRNFKITPEPLKSDASKIEGPLVFVIQKHSARSLHYDLRLEVDGVLKSWALPKGPTLDPEQKHLAVMVEDHPIDYRFFEGEIPEGQYGAGQVIIWDYGTYSPESQGVYYFDNRSAAEELMRKDIEKGKIAVILRGQKLHGSFTLVKIQKRQKDWLFIKHRDKYADSKSSILEDERSVAADQIGDAVNSNNLNKTSIAGSLKDMDLSTAKKEPIPSSISPMLATLTDEPFNDKDWFFEPKLDGYRIISFIDNKSVVLKTRNGLNVTARYDLIVPELNQIPVSTAIFDGEIIALDGKGRQCFQCLQNYLEAVRGSQAESVALIYYIFDILYLDGNSLLNIPLSDRKKVLNSVLKAGNFVRPIDYFEGSGKTLYDAAITNGLEGIMAKKKDSLYETGKRSKYWLKIKSVLTDEFVVGGFTAGTGTRSDTFGALILGYYQRPNELVYSSNVGTGFDQEKLQSIKNHLDKLKINDSPFTQMPDLKNNATWVRPETVVEVKYGQLTKDGRLRAPVFLRIRQDKSAGEVTGPETTRIKSKDLADKGRLNSERDHLVERIRTSGDSLTLEVEDHKISFDNLKKELWPAFENKPAVTKKDFINYLAESSSLLLPHLKDRPLTFNRFPEGIYGEHFFQKHWNSPLPAYVETVMLRSEHRGGETQYMMCNNLATLFWLGQIANLEIHTWFSRISPLPEIKKKMKPDEMADFPDFIIFDIDPFIYSGEEKEGEEPELNRKAFEAVCQVALWIKEVLDKLSLTSFIKTSGATGLHIHVPVIRKYDYGFIRKAAGTIAKFVQNGHPKDITLDWTVERRRNKIFIDYNQNVRGKTLASVYSLRPRKQASISMPLKWEEVGHAYPDDFTIFTIQQRLKRTGDLWKDILESKNDLKSVLEL